MPGVRGKRNEGVCIECATRKRKCDKQKPKCTQCLKQNRRCEYKTFKPWTAPRTVRSNASLNSPKLRDASMPQAPQSVDVIFETSPIASKSLATFVHCKPPRGTDSRNKKPSNSLPMPACSVLASPSNHSPAPVASILSLPDDILDTPLHRLLWSYFVIRGTKIFLCWDTNKFGLDEWTGDPYTAALASLAVHSQPLRLAALGLSAFLYLLDRPGAFSDMQVVRLNRLTVSALNQDIPNTYHGPMEKVLTALTMQLWDRNNATNWLQLARSAAAQLTTNRQLGYGANGAHHEIALHLLRWASICTQSSLNSCYDDEGSDAGWQALEFRDEELDTTYCQQFRSWIIHPLYTFSHRWINPFIKLSRLIHLRSKTHRQGSTVDAAEYAKNVKDTEEQIVAAREMDLLAFLQGSDDLTDLLNLNEALYSAIILLYATRLKDIPRNADLTIQHVEYVCEYAESISPYSRSLNNVVFPVFVAGCEAVDELARRRVELLLKRLHPAGYWFNQESRLITTLRHIWSIRDASPEALWPEWSNKVLLDGIECTPV